MTDKPELKLVEDFELQITVDPSDARIILDALDLYMRVHMGQVEEVASVLWDRGGHGDEARQAIMAFKKAVFPECPPNGSFGIANAPYPKARRAYDIFQAIRFREAWTRMPGGPKVHGPTVNFDTPLPVTNKPLPDVEAIQSLLDRIAVAAKDPQKKGKKSKRPPV